MAQVRGPGPSPMKLSRPDLQSQSHSLPRSMALHLTREQQGPPSSLGNFLSRGQCPGLSRGSFQSCVSPQRDQPQRHPHFTDEQTEGGAPWPGLADRSCSQHIFIEHRLCARPSEGMGGLRDESHTDRAPEALTAWQGGRSLRRTLTIQWSVWC